MRRRMFPLVAGAGLTIVTPLAAAQNTGSAPADEDSGGFGLEEIVVTARRRAESLQDVPQTVDAVTADELEKLSIQRFEDVQAIVPGLQMSSGASGFTTAATIRGASFQVESSASPTVEFYLNDAPIQSIFLFQQMYDVGQIEVLRGPQGTLRGRASPSGSITVTTRAPDLSEFGGYVNTLATDENAYMAQGAVNIPIVEDSLAVRLAAIWDENDYNQVRSINNGADPRQETKSGRATVRWELSDALTASIMYQYLERDLRSFAQFQSFSLVDPGGAVVEPTIRPEDRLGILDGAQVAHTEMDIVTGQLDWRFAGQKLSYVGAYNSFDLDAQAPQDGGNLVPDFEFFQDLRTYSHNQSHELRLASEERLFGSFDYTVGAFYQEFSSPSDLTNRTLVAMQTGPYTLRNLLVVDTPIQRRGTSEETSLFANLTWHISDQTELSAGARHIDYTNDSSLIVNGATLSNLQVEDDPTIWTLAASHRFDDNLMLYANIGTSWRAGPEGIGVFRPRTPRLDQFLTLDAEDSTSYELGLKADFMDRRLRVNLSAFRQDFENFIYRGPAVWYVNLSRSGPVPGTFNFLANVDAIVDGAELDLAFQATPNLNVGLTFAYANGEMDNGVIACNDFDGDGRPDRNPPTAPSVAQIAAAAGPGEAVAACTVNDTISFAPDWSATLRTEYTHPITSRMDVFGRALYSYYTDTQQDPNNRYDDVDAYGLLNLYAGLRDTDGTWEVSLFARNALDTGEVLNRGNGPATTSYTSITGAGSSLASPYMTTSYTAPREFGISLRYAFGSR